MAVFQAADSFELFTGRTPDRNRMLRHFSRLMDRDGMARKGAGGATAGQTEDGRSSVSQC